MPTAAARPYLVFLFLMGIVVAAESAALASRAMMIRPGLARPRTISRIEPDALAAALRPKVSSTA